MPGDEVGGAGAGGAHAHADPTGDPRVAVGGVGAALLVADEDVAQLRVVAEDVVERQDDAARVAEEDVDALAQQRLAQDVRPDARALEVAPLVEHALAGALDRRRLGRAVIGHVAAPGRRTRGRARRRPGRLRRFSLGDRHLDEALLSMPENERPSPPGEGPEGLSVVSALAALVPPRPSVPPGAGNQPKKAVKPRKREEKVEKG